MKYVLLLAAFLAFASPASAADPQPIFLGSKVAVGPLTQPVDLQPTTLYASAINGPEARQQAIAGYFEAYSASQGVKGSGQADAVGIFGYGWSANPNGVAVGAYLEGHAVCPTGPCSHHAQGAEIRSGNYTSTDSPYWPNAASPTLGIWLTTDGRLSSAAIQVGSIGASRWRVGMGFNQGSVVETTIRDDSSSKTSIDIKGNHETAINVAPGAGAVKIGGPLLIGFGGVLKQVEIGSADSCGAGYRCLRVRN